MNIFRSLSMRTQQRCMFFKGRNTVNMLRSQSVLGQEHYIQYVRTLRSHKNIMNIRRSHSLGTPIPQTGSLPFFLLEDRSELRYMQRKWNP